MITPSKLSAAGCLSTFSFTAGLILLILTALSTLFVFTICSVSWDYLLLVAGITVQAICVRYTGKLVADHSSSSTQRSTAFIVGMSIVLGLLNLGAALAVRAVLGSRCLHNF